MGFGVKGTTTEPKIYETDALPFRLIDSVGFEPTFSRDIRLSNRWGDGPERILTTKSHESTKCGFVSMEPQASCSRLRSRTLQKQLSLGLQFLLSWWLPSRFPNRIALKIYVWWTRYSLIKRWRNVSKRSYRLLLQFSVWMMHSMQLRTTNQSHRCHHECDAEGHWILVQGYRRY